MGHYAKVEDGIVTQVIVAKFDYIQTLPDRESWIKTSYNTHRGVHYKDGNGYEIDDSKPPIRKNYASIGYIYNADADAFYPPRPYESWTLNSETYQWEPPTPIPVSDTLHEWNEENQSWNPV